MTPGAYACAALVALAAALWPARAARGLPASHRQSRGRSAESPTETVGSVATALDLLALALGSGVPLVDAIAAVAERSGPVVRRDLSQVVAALRWGVDEYAAWSGLPEVWRPAGRALSLAAAAGVPPAALLRDASRDLRRQERAELDEAAARLGVRIVIPLGLCFLPAFALLTVVPAVAALAGQVLASV